MIDFVKHKDLLLFRYSGDYDISWIDERLEDSGEVCFCHNSFCFQEDDQIKADNKDNEEYFGDYYEEQTRLFIFGKLIGEYYFIDKKKIEMPFDVYVERTIELDSSYFVFTNSNLEYYDKNGKKHSRTKYGTILRALKQIYKHDKLYIDCNDDCLDDGMHISKKLYKEFLELIPTQTEVKMRNLAILAARLKEELDVSDIDYKYEQYIYKRANRVDTNTEAKIIKENEVVKLKYCVDMIESLLKSEEVIPEDIFTKQIVNVFRLINSKYIKINYKFNIIDAITIQDDRQVKRQPDVALIDCNGNIDLIEVKNPIRYPRLFRLNKYRDHYVFCGELNGSICQMEQYLRSLTKMSQAQINAENEELAGELGIELRAVHPKGYIIFGRDLESFGNDNETNQKKKDFEVIKNSYSDIVDIMTFDQLLERIKRMLNQLEK